MLWLRSELVVGTWLNLFFNPKARWIPNRLWCFGGGSLRGQVSWGAQHLASYHLPFSNQNNTLTLIKIVKRVFLVSLFGDHCSFHLLTRAPTLVQLMSHLPKRVTSMPTIREPSRPPIAKIDTVSEYMRVRVSSVSAAPVRFIIVLL